MSQSKVPCSIIHEFTQIHRFMIGMCKHLVDCVKSTDKALIVAFSCQLTWHNLQHVHTWPPPTAAAAAITTTAAATKTITAAALFFSKYNQLWSSPCWLNVDSPVCRLPQFSRLLPVLLLSCRLTWISNLQPKGTTDAATVPLPGDWSSSANTSYSNGLLLLADLGQSAARSTMQHIPVYWYIMSDACKQPSYTELLNLPGQLVSIAATIVVQFSISFTAYANHSEM